MILSAQKNIWGDSPSSNTTFLWLVIICRTKNIIIVSSLHKKWFSLQLCEGHSLIHSFVFGAFKVTGTDSYVSFQLNCTMP